MRVLVCEWGLPCLTQYLCLGSVLSVLLEANADGLRACLNKLWKTDKSPEAVQEKIKSLAPPEEKVHTSAASSTSCSMARDFGYSTD